MTYFTRIWALRGLHLSPLKDARDEDCKCLQGYHPICLWWYSRRIIPTAGVLRVYKKQTNHKKLKPKSVKIISYSMELAGGRRRQINAVLQTLRLSETPEEFFIKQTHQKNYWLLLDGFFSPSPIMGKVHEENLGEAMTDRNTYLSLKRFDFWGKWENWTTSSSSIWNYMKFNQDTS